MSTDTVFRLLYTIYWPIFNFLHPIKAVGRENIPEGAAVICPNHTTAGDPFYAVLALGLRWPMRAVAQAQIMRVPFIGWGLS